MTADLGVCVICLKNSISLDQKVAFLGQNLAGTFSLGITTCLKASKRVTGGLRGFDPFSGEPNRFALGPSVETKHKKKVVNPSGSSQVHKQHKAWGATFS